MRGLRRAGLGLLALCAATACAPIDPLGAPPEGPVTLVSYGAHQAEVDAAGRRVVVRAPAGGCLSEEMMSFDGAAAFMMVEDCRPEDAPADDPTPLRTISIGAAGLTDGRDGGDALVVLDSFLASDAGRAELGLGGPPETVEFLDSLQDGDALYVLFEDRGATLGPIAGRACRAFLEVNDRVALVTVASLASSGTDDGTLFAHARAMVAALRLANPVPEPPPLPRPRPRAR